MPTLHLIRHGKASPAKASYDELHPRGEEQARLLGTYLGDNGQDYDAVYCGPLRRQRETLRLMREAAGAPGAAWPLERILPELEEAPLEPLLRELMPARLAADSRLAELIEEVQAAGDDRRALRAATVPVYQYMVGLWMAGSVSAPGLETSEAFLARAQRAYRTIVAEVAPDAHVAVVTSSGVIAAVLEHVDGIAERAQQGPAMLFANSSLSQVRVEVEGPQVLSRDLTPHLSDPRLITIL